MYSLAIIFSFLSVWGFYITSNRIEFNKTGFTRSIANKRIIVRFISGLLFIISAILFCYSSGITIGISIITLLYMLMLGLVVLFAPYNCIKISHFLLIVILIIGLEFIVNTM
ncbi:hypothetical protein GCM10022397_02810 [Flavivirga jejuensis]